MAHNVHYIIIDGVEGSGEAVSRVWDEIGDWGTIHNWKSIVGVLSRETGIYTHIDQDINKRFTKDYTEDVIVQDLNSLLDITPLDIDVISKVNLGEGDIYDKNMVYTHFKDIYNMPETKNFNLWQDEMYSWKLDSVGVTNMWSIGEKDAYCVVIDVHS
jgi:hypothetical protein